MIDHILWEPFIEALREGERTDVDGSNYMANCGGSSHCSACNRVAQRYLERNHPHLLGDIVKQTGRETSSLIENGLNEIDDRNS